MAAVEKMFVCTECGSFEGSTRLQLAPSDAHGAWSGIVNAIRCARCGYTIPVHLGERWNDITIEQAREQWLRIFRPTAQRRTVPVSPLGTNLNETTVLKSTIEELRLERGGLYRVVKELDFRKCYRSVGGTRTFDDTQEPLLAHRTDFLFAVDPSE